MLTIAHEIGHFILHNEDVQHHNIDSSNYADLTQEKDANNFATELLMPETQFINKFRTIETKDIFKKIKILSDFFGLSDFAIVSRAYSLGLFDAI